MDKEIKDYILKLSGKASLLEELINDHEYNLKVNGEITEETEKSNNDGSYNIIYKFQPKIIEIESDSGEVVKTKDIRKRSQKLRGMIYYFWQDYGADSHLSADEFYNRFMDKLMVNLSGVIEFLHSIKDN